MCPSWHRSSINCPLYVHAKWSCLTSPSYHPWQSLCNVPCMQCPGKPLGRIHSHRCLPHHINSRQRQKQANPIQTLVQVQTFPLSLVRNQLPSIRPHPPRPLENPCVLIPLCPNQVCSTLKGVLPLGPHRFLCIQFLPCHLHRTSRCRTPSPSPQQSTWHLICKLPSFLGRCRSTLALLRRTKSPALLEHSRNPPFPPPLDRTPSITPHPPPSITITPPTLPENLNTNNNLQTITQI